MLLFAVTVEAQAAAKPRPLSGMGLLQVRPLPGGHGAGATSLVIYREPGLGRLAEMVPDRLPSLSPALKPSEKGFQAVVINRKRGWLRIVYDESDREGWVQMRRFWAYTPWTQFLKGRIVKLLPGTKKGYANLRAAAADAGPVLFPLTSDLPLRVVQVDGDWAMVIAGLNLSGWLRWRDDNGRFLVAVDDRFDPQKH